jgi:hypothetical protein
LSNSDKNDIDCLPTGANHVIWEALPPAATSARNGGAE